MPAAIPLDIRAKVKAVAIQIGVREAARQFELPEATVQAWSSRDGWFIEQAQVKEVKAKVMEERGLQPAATKSVSDVLLAYGEQTKLGFSKAIAKVAKHTETLDAQDILEQAGKVKDLIAGAAKLHGWESGNPTSTVNIAFLSQD